jgi:hypothetical protein
LRFTAPLSNRKTFAPSDQYLGEFKGKRYPSVWLRPSLLTRGSAGAVVNHVTTQCHDQGRLLEEAKRDLEVFKKAYYKAERDIHDRDERFELEKQALSDEIHQLKVRLFTPPPTPPPREFQVPPPQFDLVYGNPVILIVPSCIHFRLSRLVKNGL